LATCATCGAGDLVEGARFCHVCGTAQASVCSSCGAALVPGARFCSTCGTSQPGGAGQAAVAPPAAPVSERKVTSVLFADLVGFTSISEHRDHEEIRELLTRYFDEARRIIGRYGGTVEKFIGDAVMAVWGVPVAHEDDAERAVRAGLELTRMVTDLGEDVGLTGVALRVGIVTGEVAVTIGAQGQGMVAGDAVNTASRVQSAAEPGGVWVDETTRVLTTAAITYQDVGSHTLKGKVDPVPLWSVRAVVAAVGGHQRADGLEAPYVGMDRELRLMKELFHATHEAGRPSLLIVDGEAGLGKTRLGWEFFKYVDGLTQKTVWHQGKCAAYGEGAAYLALAEAVRGRLGQVELDDDADLGERIDAGLLRYVPDEAEREWLAPRLGALLGTGSVGTFVREDLFAAWVTFLERAGEGRAVVLLIDDAQHADEGLLAFVEYMLSAASFACFIALLTRPGLIEEHPGLVTNRRSTVVHISSLDASDMARLISGLVVGLPDDVLASLVDRAEGVPLYAVETVRSLIDRDLVLPRGGQYVLADASVLDLQHLTAPASLQAIVAARLDKLSTAQRRVVNAACLYGSAFSRDDIAALAPDLEDLDDVLETLLRQQILSKETNRLSAEVGKFKFVQTVVRQVAYSTLSRHDRKAGHLAVAQHFEGSPEADVDAIVAQHYIGALEAVPGAADISELQRRSVSFLLRAASRARALGVPREAQGHLERALQHVEASEERAPIQLELARALFNLGRFDESAALALEVTEAFDAADDEVSAAAAAAVAADALYRRGSRAEAQALARPRWDALQGNRQAAHALLALAHPLSANESGVYDWPVLQRRIQLAERLGDPAEIAACLTTMSLAHGANGALALARTLMHAGADLAREHHLPVDLARALTNLTSDTMQFDTDEAVVLGREAVEVARRSGVVTWRSFSAVNLLLALWLRADWDDAEALIVESGDMADDENHRTAIAVQGWIRHARGERSAAPWPPQRDFASDDGADQAWHLLEDAVRARLDGDSRLALQRAVDASRTFLDWYGLTDDFSHAFALAMDLALELDEPATLQQLLDFVDGADSAVPLSVTAHRARAAGLVGMRVPNPDEGAVETSLRQAVDLYRQWGVPMFLALAQADLGTWLVRHGRSDEAASLLDAAREILAGLGAVALLEQLDAQLVAST